MWVGGGGVSSSGAEADRYTETCHSSYLNPHPVPPRTIAARRIAPAMDPIMILVPLGPAQRKEEGGERGRRKGRKRKYNKHTHTHRQKINHVMRQNRHGTSTSQKELKRGGATEK